MCPIDLPLHVERMVRWIERERMRDQGHNIDEQDDASADAGPYDRCRALPKSATGTRSHSSSYQETDQCQTHKGEQEEKEGCGIPYKQPSEAAENDKQGDNNNADIYGSVGACNGISYDGANDYRSD